MKTYDTVGDESHRVGRNEALLVHPLSTVPPVLNCPITQTQKLDRLHYMQIILTFHLSWHDDPLLIPIKLIIIENPYII